MSKRINVADLPEFDAAPYLGSEVAIAAYLSDILQANDASWVFRTNVTSDSGIVTSHSSPT